MYDELKATGQVDKSLPEDERLVREAYDREVLAPQLAERDKERADVVAMPSPLCSAIIRPSPASRPPLPPAPASGASIAVMKPAVASVTQLPPRPAATEPVKSVATAEVIQVEFGEREGARLAHLSAAGRRRRNGAIDRPEDGRAALCGRRQDGGGSVRCRCRKSWRWLSISASVWDETVVDWQDQARLVCMIPGLRGTHAQLLVGAGYRSRDAVAAAAEDKLCADVLTFAMSSEGQRVLRDGNPPDIERIKGWLASAKAAKVA